MTKNLTILIPTRVPDRTRKLLDTLRSIPAHRWIATVVVCDGGGAHDLLETIRADRDLLEKTINVFETKQHAGSVATRNAAIPMVSADLLWATDDIEFREGAIEHAYAEFHSRYPDGDGVVGFIQEGVNSYHPCGVGITGQKFLDRYPDHQLFNPEYWHFACQEIQWLADDRLGKFYLDPEARLYHRHPAFHKAEMDRTHAEGRTRRREDHELIKQRQAAGLCWGSAE